MNGFDGICQMDFYAALRKKIILDKESFNFPIIWAGKKHFKSLLRIHVIFFLNLIELSLTVVCYVLNFVPKYLFAKPFQKNKSGN